jgi:hypothetical protein
MHIDSLSIAARRTAPHCPGATLQTTNRNIAMNASIEDPRVWHRIVPYVDQAFDMPVEQIGKWLDDLQCTQPDIASLVRELLVERDRLNATGFLTEPMLTTGVAWLTLGGLLREKKYLRSEATLSQALDRLSRTVSSDHLALLQLRKLLTAG